MNVNEFVQSTIGKKMAVANESEYEELNKIYLKFIENTRQRAELISRSNRVSKIGTPRD